MYWQKSDKGKSGWRKPWRKRKAGGPESPARARPFACLLLAAAGPRACRGLASLSTLTATQGLLVSSWSVVLTPSGALVPDPCPSLLPSALHPLSSWGQPPREARSCSSSPAPAVVTGTPSLVGGPRLITPTAGPSSPSLQPCSICCHLSATAWHRLWTVSLPSWTISSYLLSAPCTYSLLCLTSLKTLSFDFSFSLELELYRVWLSFLPSFLVIFPVHFLRSVHLPVL